MAVIVTGLGAVATVVTNACLASKRFDHDKRLQRERLDREERMQAQRLEHERIEAIRTTAAEAYGKSRSVLVHVTPDTVVTMGRYPAEQGELNARKLIGEASDALSVVGAVGWDEAVRTTALELRDEITNLAESSWLLTKTMRQQAGYQVSDEAREMVREANENVETAVDAYRRAVAGEEGD